MNNSINPITRYILQKRGKEKPSQDLLRKAKRYKKAQEEVVYMCAKFVLRCVGRFASKVDINVLFNAGVIGLLEAIDVYDPEKGAFSSIANSYIIKEARMAAYTETELIRHPVYIREIEYIYKQTIIKLRQENISVTSENVAKHSKLPIKTVEFFKRNRARAVISINIQDKDDEESNLLNWLIPGYKPKYPTMLFIRSLFRYLKPNQKQVIKLRYGIDHPGPATLQEAGIKMNISRERVRQIQQKAEEKLREIIKEQDQKNEGNF